MKPFLLIFILVLSYTSSQAAHKINADTTLSAPLTKMQVDDNTAYHITYSMSNGTIERLHNVSEYDVRIIRTNITDPLIMVKKKIVHYRDGSVGYSKSSEKNEFVILLPRSFIMQAFTNKNL